VTDRDSEKLVPLRAEIVVDYQKKRSTTKWIIEEVTRQSLQAAANGNKTGLL
jgi:hypothetical protein